MQQNATKVRDSPGRGAGIHLDVFMAAAHARQSVMDSFAQISPQRICVALLACWVLFRFVITTRKALFTPLRHVPGPWHAPWTNLWLKAQVMQGNRCHYIHSLHERYGPFVRISPDEVAIADLATIKQVYRVGSPFLKSEWYQKFNESSYPGIFSMTNAKEHAVRRRLFAQSFSKSSLTQYEPQVRKKVDVATDKINRDLNVRIADILKWFTFMATDVIGELSFGQSFNMLEQEAKTPYIVDLETAMMISGICVELGPLVRIAKTLPIPAVQNALKINNRLDQYGFAAIENHKTHVMDANDKGTSSLFSKILDPSKNQELALAQVATEASNLIVAGSDTTAVSLTYMIWSILRPQHHDIKRKLMAEFDPLPIDTPVSQLGQLRYLNAVITESLRLYGAAPGSLPRICPQEGVKLGRYFIPGGTTVSVQAYTVHRDASIFSNPNSFVPERWENPTEAMKDAYFPFGLGSRVCIGLHLAMNELLLGVFLFIKKCPNAVLAASTTDSSMEMENYFLIAPKAHRCELAMKS